MAFLTGWRLALAADLLLEPGATVGAVRVPGGLRHPVHVQHCVQTRVRPQPPRRSRPRPGLSRYCAGLTRPHCDTLTPMAHVELDSIRFELPDGRVLLDDVSFRVAGGAKVALVGANGSGKTTLLRIVAGDLKPHAGTVSRSGGLGVMRQFITETKEQAGVAVRDLLLAVAPPAVQAAARELDAAELAMVTDETEASQMRYARALADWGDAGGYDIEVLWDVCCTEALGAPFGHVQWRPATSLSGGEQKRLVLEALLRGPDEILLLDEPDNYLDVPGKQWLEARLRDTTKSVLLVSHDRELLANAATHIVTIELGAAATPPGYTAAGSRRTTTTGSTDSNGWRSCGAGGTRIASSSAPRC